MNKFIPNRKVDKTATLLEKTKSDSKSKVQNICDKNLFISLSISVIKRLPLQNKPSLDGLKSFTKQLQLILPG